MSQRRQYNLRSRKQVNYNEEAPVNIPAQSPRSPPRSKKLSSQSKPSTSKKKKGKQSEKNERTFEDENFHSMHDSNSYPYDRDVLEPSTDGSDFDTLPSENHDDIRRRVLHNPNKTFNESAMQNAQNHDIEEKDAHLRFSDIDEPDSTLPDLGLSPIKHEDSIGADMEYQRRDRYASYPSKEPPRPILKRRKSKEDVMQELQSSIKWQILGSILCLIIISCLAVAITILYEDFQMRPISSRKARLEKHMEKLKVQFPSQTFRFWNVLGGASLDHVHNPETLERPIVILLAGTSESALTMRCLANRIAVMYDDMFLQTSYAPIFIKGESYVKIDADQTKMKIDKKLKTGFESGAKSAVVQNIDNLPPCSVLLFHSFCENENAPYKDAAFVITLQLGMDEIELDGLKPRAIDGKVYEHLKTRWNDCLDLPSDKQDAILSRIANNIAKVKAEDPADLRKNNCPSS